MHPRGSGERSLRTVEPLPRPFPALAAWFRLRPGARPLADAMFAPATGVVVAAGPISATTVLRIQGVPLDLRRLTTTGRGPALDLRALDGGRYVTTLLTPHGDPRVHAPLACTVLDLHWVPGRAVAPHPNLPPHLPRIHDRHERLGLRCRAADGHEFILVLVGAGIHLVGRERPAWARPGPTRWHARFDRGAELGRVTAGATVVLLAPPALAGPPPATGATVRAGERLW